MKKQKRECFSSGVAVFFATLGSALGLGNMWKFPNVVGANGGGAFLFIYLIFVFLVGIPVMIGEFYIGRKTRKNAVGAFNALKSNPFWKIIGYMGIISSFLIMFFYSAVAGWVYAYVFKGIKGDFSILSTLGNLQASEASQSIFLQTIGAGEVGGFTPMIWQVIVLIIVSAILIAGVKKGIERITKTLLPVLFVLILICDIRALTLPGAKEGLNFLFNPDFSKVTTASIMTAMGLAFFKLSLGMGTMITYGSYFTDDNNLFKTPLKVAFSDVAVSLLAGIAIFPVVFSFGMQPEGAGLGLLFKTIPLIFLKLPFGNLLLVAFFFLTSIAATTAMISLAEVPVAYFTEEKNMDRKKAVLITAAITILVGLLTVHPKSILGTVVVAGKSFFDWFDFISSNILLPSGGLLIAIFVGYVVSKDDLKYELSNKNTINVDGTFNIYRLIIRYITPIFLIVVFLNSLGILKL